MTDFNDAVDVFATELFDVFRKGGKLLVCGNGGSMADAQHIAAELCKPFKRKRCLSDKKQDYFSRNEIFNIYGGLPVVALGCNNALLTATANDQGYDAVFAQEVEALGKDGDALLVITTSGMSSNIIAAMIVAQSKEMTVFCLTGQYGMPKFANFEYHIQSIETDKIQEEHEKFYHALCAAIERMAFGDE